MDRKLISRGLKLYVPLFFVFVILLMAMPRLGKFKYDYKKGTPWAYDNLVSEIDFPILKTEAQLQSEKEEAGSGIVPYYRYEDEVGVSVMHSVENIDYGKYAYIKPDIIDAVSGMYERGIMGDSSSTKDDGYSTTDNVIFVQHGKRAAEVPASDVYTLSAAKARLVSSLARKHQGINADSVLSASGVYPLIVPNLVYDKETTDLVHAEKVDYISPTRGFVPAGHIIVSKGEIVTPEIEQLLDSYKAEYESSLGYSGPKSLLWIGNAILALAIVLILYLSIYYTNPDIFSQFNRYLYLLFIFVLAAFAALTVDRIDPSMLYLVPFTLTALYLLAFFRRRVVLPVYVLSLIPLLVFAHNGIELFVLYLVSGVITMYVFEKFSTGWLQFVTALIAFVSMTLTFIGFRFVTEDSPLDDYRLVMYMLFGSVLSVAGYPLIYLMEKIFGLVSDSRLTELADPNNKLLRILAQKAPGTFQHSLQVMNLADAAARSIGANVLLVRAGAMYHDIGKTMNPRCFVENESIGDKFHDSLTPIESAQMIIRHVSDGMALAAKYKLPEVVSDFIITHHGTTCVAYFYNKYLKEGGSPDNISEFCYKGKKPWTREQTILMICDTLEAASRTLKDNTPATFDKFVEDIVSSKISAGQLDNSDISLRELTRIKSVLKSYLAQIYHERIVYPKTPTTA